MLTSYFLNSFSLKKATKKHKYAIKVSGASKIDTAIKKQKTQKLHCNLTYI